MRRLRAAVLLAGLLVLAAPPAAADEADDWVIERFGADVEVGADGDVAVSERIEVDFTGVELHGIFREIPVRYELSADYVGGSLPEGADPSRYELALEVDDLTVDATAPDDVETELEGDWLVVRIGDPDTTVTGPHTYELSYTLRGALVPVGDHVELVLDVLGEWQVPTRQAVARVTAPSVLYADCAAGPPDATQGCEVTAEDATVTATAADLEPGDGLTVEVRMPPDAVDAGVPVLEEPWRLADALAGHPAALPLTAVTTVLGAGTLVALARRGRDERDPRPEAAGAGPRFDPPEGLSPAEVAVVERQRVEHRDLSATLLDLARRGHLTLTEQHPEDGDDDEEPDWRVRRGDADAGDLRPYERDLVDRLLRGSDEVTLSERRDGLVLAYPRFRDQLLEESVTRGWFRENPRTARVRWQVVGGAALLTATALFVALLAFSSVAAAAIPLVLAAGGVLPLAGRMPRRTAEGARLAREARAFRDFLEADTAHAASSDPRHAFGRYLPYAVTFGAVPALLARFEAAALAPEEFLPAWYAASGAAWHDPSSLSSSLGTFVGSAGGGPSTAGSTGTSGSGVSVGGGVGGGGGGGW